MKNRTRRFYRSKPNNKVFGGENENSFFAPQTKLEVGQPGDQYEQEADRMADEVVNKSNLLSNGNDNKNFGTENIQEKELSEQVTPLIQQKEEAIAMQPAEEEEEAMQMQPEEEEEEMLQPQPLEEEEEMVQAQPEEEEEEIQLQRQEEEEMMQTQPEEEEEPLQMQEEEEEEMQMQEEEEEELQPKRNGKGTVTPALESKLHSKKNLGSKMDATTQQEMEQSFGADFNQVNIHTDSDAEKMTQQVGAQAFTHGRDIYFNKGRYNPKSDDGKHLLAHELTHTIQQTGRVVPQLQYTVGDNQDLQSARFAGDLVLEACHDGERTLAAGSSGAPVRKIQQALVDAGFALPVYGVDGIFGAETRSAVQSFQSTSSLAQTGVIEANTMSSLDGLFAYGAPTLPSGPPANVAPTITSETIKLAPNNFDITRTDVGVGERVRFTGNTAGTWSVSAGRIIGINNGENMVWEAPAIAANPTVTLTTPAGSASINMTVIAPASLHMTVNRNEPIPVGTAGACMITDVVVHPLTVSFGRTHWFEVPGPATSVTGYYNRFPAADLYHHPNPDYLPFNDDNSGLTDHAATHAEPPPYSAGMFQWVVPNRYKIDGEPDANGRFFTNTTQSFYITSTGTVMVTKAGAFVLRFINNTII